MPWMESKYGKGGEDGEELSVYGVQEHIKTSTNTKRVIPDSLIVAVRL